MSVRKVISMVLLNVTIAVVLILCYSPGYLDLRPDDESILRAGFSILIPFFAIAVFILGNMSLLKEKEYKSVDSISDTGTAGKILEQYTKSRLFGKTAGSALNQLSRLEALRGSLPDIISGCFSSGSMSHTKYMSAVDDACGALFANIETMARRINLFDEKNYWYLLKHYKSDDIPDGIQEEQIRQYESEIASVKNCLGVNEKVLVKLGELKNSLLSMGHDGQTKQQDRLLDDVARMTDELKYYEEGL